MALFRPPGGPKSGIFDEKCDGLTCKNVLPTEGRKHFFKKVSKNGERKLLRACGADAKERMAGATHKLKGVVHMVVFPVGALGVEKCTGLGREYVFQEAHGAKQERTERTKER